MTELPSAESLPVATPPQIQAAQTTPEDAKNRMVELSPALMEEIVDSPESIKPMVRGMAAMNLWNLFVNIQHPRTTNKDRLEFQSTLNKMAGLETKDANAQGGTPQVIINITRAKDSESVLHIESMAAPTEPEPIDVTPSGTQD